MYRISFPVLYNTILLVHNVFEVLAHAFWCLKIWAGSLSGIFFCNQLMIFNVDYFKKYNIMIENTESVNFDLNIYLSTNS